MLTIPNTARKDNWNEILNNTNGSKQRKTKAVTNNMFILSPSSEVNRDKVSKESIVATLRAEGVRPTINAIIQLSKTITIYLIYNPFNPKGTIFLRTKENAPTIIIICKPDTQSI